MDNKPLNPKKYVTEFCTELVGKSFMFVMDDGYEYVASFLTGDAVMWAKHGEPFVWEKYHCLKSDDTTYFVIMDVANAEVRTLRTVVIDLEQALVTFQIARQGLVPGRPRLVKTEFIFGAIRQDNKELTFKRHAFSDELVGRKITWHYSSGFVNTHIYTSENYYRIRPLEKEIAPADSSQEVLDKIKAQEEQDAKWLYEEPFRCVKIKDNCWLCSGIEENMNRVNNMTGGNNLVFLTNMNVGLDVGRTFSMNSLQEPECGMFRSTGEFIEEDTAVEHKPSPYRV